ncbi:MAG: Hsp20 family protein [Candidatus Acidiferrales bacterium]
MQQHELARTQATEPPIAIKTTGLSAEAKQMFDSIARRAYEIFESTGRVGGRELEHWLQAESELFQRTPIDVKESRDGLTVLADVRGFAPKELEVDLEPKRVTIIGRHQSQADLKTSASRSSEACAARLLRSLQLPVEIDTRHATARLQKGILELDVKKSLAAKGNIAQAVSGSSAV